MPPSWTNRETPGTPWTLLTAWHTGCLLMCLGGCGLFQQEEVVYLKEAEKLHATQDEVKRRLGNPRVTKALPNGDMVWLYHIWTNTGGDLNGPSTTFCDQYSLRFDREAILREWKHQGC